MTTNRYARTTDYIDEDNLRLLATVRYQGRWICRCYGPDEQVVEYTEWSGRDAAENHSRRYVESVS